MKEQLALAVEQAKLVPEQEMVNFFPGSSLSSLILIIVSYQEIHQLKSRLDIDVANVTAQFAPSLQRYKEVL